jgi:glycosyltransferase involved in cell wall biosynthesis
VTPVTTPGHYSASQPRQPGQVITYLLYSATGSHNLQKKLGLAEYSYFFVREKFLAMLKKRTTAIVVADTENEVDAIFDDLRSRGRDCVFLAFCPPHRMPPKTRCPTIPVFAWEFDTIPNEIWGDDARNDWRTVLSREGQAITHSRYSVQAVKSAMGMDFHVDAIPAPVWDDFSLLGGLSSKRAADETFAIELIGTVVDSEQPSTFADARLNFMGEKRPPTLADRWKVKKRRAKLSRMMRRVVGLKPKPEPKPSPRPQTSIRLELKGTIFLSVLNPLDGRKNWEDMLTAFCHSLANCPDATLILKFISADCSEALALVRSALVRLPPFRCRVVAIDAFLDDMRYRELIAASTFVVNSSLGEGQCLPLMEAMSCGKPVIAPQHTGMRDYVDGQVGFIVRSSLELCSWPHDPRNAFRARRYRCDWLSLVEAYRAAYTLAKEQPASYQRMSEAAVARMQDYCSEQTVYEKLQLFVSETLARSRTVPGAGADHAVDPARFSALNGEDGIGPVLKAATRRA